MRRRAAIPEAVARLVRALAFCAVLLSFVSAEDAEGAPLSMRDPPSNLSRSMGPLGRDLNGPVDCPPYAEGGIPCERVDPVSDGAQGGAPIADGPPPTPSVRLELTGCLRETQAWACEQPPVLSFVGLPAYNNDPIVAVYVAIDGMDADCGGPICDVPLEPTPEEGSEVMFSFETMYGEPSEPQYALVRVLEAASAEAGAPPGWQVEILSSQIDDDRMDRCGLAWFSLPSLDGPEWLVLPEGVDDLRTSESYVYLEKRLANLGLAAEALTSAATVLSSAQNVNLTTAQPVVEIWQNQFDSAILDSASARGLPGRLVKGLFAAESQFWPGSFPEIAEVGLGQLSDQGADALLLWSPPFYTELCPQVLDAELCRQGYWRLEAEEKAMLRGAVWGMVNADCSDCAYGLDLAKAERSVPVFMEGLVASCSQTAQVVDNSTRNTPGFLSSYEDLWRFTLANYNVGSGCLSEAMADTWRLRQPMDWAHVAANLPAGCQGAIDYVSRVLDEPAERTP